MMASTSAEESNLTRRDRSSALPDLPALVVALTLAIGPCPVAIADTPVTAGQIAALRGITPALVYNGTVFTNLGGGARAGSTYTGNLSLQLTVDGGSLLGWKDTVFYVSGLWIHGGQPSNFIGDAQGVSNISAPSAVKLYEAWLQKNFFDNRFSAVAGLYDLNSEFYRLQSAALFLNSSFGIGPEFAQSGLGGPSIFPDTSVGVRFAYKPAQGIVVRTALLDGVPVDRRDGTRAVFRRGDGILVVAEADFLDRPLPSDRPRENRLRIGRQAKLAPYDDKLTVGGWHYSATFDDLADLESNGQPLRHRGSSGFYALVDRVLYQEPGHPGRKFAGFLQSGYGDSRVNQFGSYIGAGLSAVGVIPRRDSDELGVAIAYARNGPHYMSSQRLQEAPVTGAETTIEITYLTQLTKWLAVQPDLQYVIYPSTNPTIPNALAFQLRFQIAF
jgi:porin